MSSDADTEQKASDASHASVCPSAAGASRPRWRELVICGGGMNGIALLGAAQQLFDSGRLRRVRRFVGTSVGAILCFLFVLGYRSDVIMGVLQGLSFARFDGIDANSMLSFFDTYGMMSNDKIFNLVRAFMRARQVAVETTFEELHARFGHELVVTGYNVSRGRLEAFSHRTHATMRVVRALEISSCIPLVFRPVFYEGDLYVDGGLVDAVPREFVRSRRRTLVLQACTGCLSDELARRPTDVFRYVLLLISRLYDRLHDYDDAANHKRRLHIISIRVRTMWDLMDFGMGNATKRELFTMGYTGARRHWEVETENIDGAAEIPSS